MKDKIIFQNSQEDILRTEDGLDIYYTTNFSHGDFDPSKKLLVFNYGLVCNVAHWREQLPVFDSLGYQILVHDYRSHFKSSKVKQIKDLSFKHMAKDVLQILNKLKSKNNILLGHSMGVNVCLEFAVTYPEMTKGLVLISGSVLPPQDIMFDSKSFDIIYNLTIWMNDKAPNIFHFLWTNSYKNYLLRYGIKSGGFNVAQVPDEFVYLYMKKISELEPEIFIQLLKEMKNHGVINHLESLETSTLIIGGDKDKVIPNYLQSMLHKYLKNSELYIVKDGSHVPQVDFPDSINQRIKLFIERL